MGNTLNRSDDLNVNKILTENNNEISHDVRIFFNRSKKDVNKEHQQKHDFKELDNTKFSIEIISDLLESKSLVHLTNCESRALGSFICSAIGNSMGAHTECEEIDYNSNKIEKFEDLKQFNNDNYLEIGEITADISMALCLADSLYYNHKKFNSIDLRIRFFLWWQYGYNNCRGNKISVGIGDIIKNSIFDFYNSLKNDKIKENEVSQNFSKQENGNGSLMRLSPLPIAFAKSNVPFHEEIIKECLKIAKEQSLSTHNGIEAYQCCMVLSYLIIKNINFDNSNNDGIDPKVFLDQNLDYNEIKKYLDQEELDHSLFCLISSKQEENTIFLKFIGQGKYDEKYNESVKDRNWNWKSQDFKYSPKRTDKNPRFIGSYCLDSLAMALHCVYHSKSSKEAILKVVNMGGDADSVAAITGQISGSIWGLDKEILTLYDYLRKYDKDKIAFIAYRLYHGIYAKN